MCLILFSYQPDSDKRLWLAANRDEFHQRPAMPARIWPQQPAIIAGQDLQAGGTWLGITRQGRFAAVTNYRNPNSVEGTISRGTLCTDFLASDTSCLDYLSQIQ
ncbi:MAG: NRDE family protein, partial [Sinobacterium sp.]